MEIELKYAAKSSAVLDAISTDSELLELMEEGSEEDEMLYGSYYDTADFDLLESGVTFRIRKEGRHSTACLKWKGKTNGPLHVREELNITLPDSDERPEADISIFRESAMGEELINIVGEKKLEKIMQVDVRRRSFKVDTGNSIAEVSLDFGSVVTEAGEDGICEMEIELYSGEQDEMLELGERMASKYDLKPETRSKFARGLALMGKLK